MSTGTHHRIIPLPPLRHSKRIIRCRLDYGIPTVSVIPHSVLEERFANPPPGVLELHVWGVHVVLKCGIWAQKWLFDADTQYDAICAVYPLSMYVGLSAARVPTLFSSRSVSFVLGSSRLRHGPGPTPADLQTKKAGAVLLSMCCPAEMQYGVDGGKVARTGTLKPRSRSMSELE